MDQQKRHIHQETKYLKHSSMGFAHECSVKDFIESLRGRDIKVILQGAVYIPWGQKPVNCCN